MAYVVMSARSCACVGPRRSRRVARGEPGVAPGRCLCRGRRLYRRFHRFQPDRVIRMRCRRTIPRLLVNLGRLRALVYASDKGRKGRPRTYIHFMEHQPWLTCDVEGRQLYVVGGRYRVTSRGIEG